MCKRERERERMALKSRLENEVLLKTINRIGDKNVKHTNTENRFIALLSPSPLVPFLGVRDRLYASQRGL